MQFHVLKRIMLIVFFVWMSGGLGALAGPGLANLLGSSSSSSSVPAASNSSTRCVDIQETSISLICNVYVWPSCLFGIILSALLVNCQTKETLLRNMKWWQTGGGRAQQSQPSENWNNEQHFSFNTLWSKIKGFFHSSVQQLLYKLHCWLWK